MFTVRTSTQVMLVVVLLTSMTLVQRRVTCRNFVLTGPSSQVDQIMLNVMIVYSFS